jgi:diacylglycerol kinase family enzyme
VFNGTHVRNPAVRVLRGAEVRVESDRPFVVYADGDPIGETPITLRALPAALQVLMPSPPTAVQGTHPPGGETPWA